MRRAEELERACRREGCVEVLDGASCSAGKTRAGRQRRRVAACPGSRCGSWRQLAHTKRTDWPALIVMVAGENCRLPLPGPTVMVGTIGAVAVNVRGEPVAPATDAVADCAPPPAPRVQVAVAMPLASVTPPGASDPFAVAQVTVTPGFATPFWVTSTRRGFGSAAPAVPVCASPLFVAVFARTSGWTTGEVAEKETGDPDAPLTDAVAVWHRPRPRASSSSTQYHSHR